jgi:hypothetical protein
MLSTRFGQAKARVLAKVEGARGLSSIDMHSLRRSFATALRNAMNAGAEINPTLIGTLMGHEQRTLALKVYAERKVLMGDLRRCIDAMWSHGLAPEVRAALLETMDRRPPMVRTEPAYKKRREAIGTSAPPPVVPARGRPRGRPARPHGKPALA